MANYDSVDLLMSEDGDLQIDPEGDLYSTSHDRIIAIQQDIRNIIQNTTGAFEHYPTLAADLTEFVGEPNTRENAEAIARKIERTLINLGTVLKGDIKVEVNASGLNSVMIQVMLLAYPTIYNTVSSQVVITLFFNSTDGLIMWAPGLSGGM